MDAYKVAVVCSGHARMVPQGHHLHQHSFALSPRVSQWAEFSYCWTDHSEVRQPNQHQQQQFALRDSILERLGDRHVYRDQDPLFDQLCERFIDEGALPDYRSDPAVNSLIRYHFGKYFGQLLGFCFAVDHWRDQLQDYDYIVRSRWDHTLDPDVLNGMDPDHFYTKSINIYNGRPIVGGDNVYGPTKKWMEIIPSSEAIIDKLIVACRQVRKEIQQHRPDWDFATDFQWFSTHYLWYLMFEYQNIHWLHRGESFGINFELAQIPLAELSLKHAALGIEYWRTGRSPVPDSAIRLDNPNARLVQPLPSSAAQRERRLRKARLEQRVQYTIEADQVSVPPKLFKN